MNRTWQLEGRNVVLEALEGGSLPRKLYVDRGAERRGKLKRILDRARELRVTVASVDRSQLNRISKTGVHQGVIAMVEPSTQDASLKGLLDALEEKGRSPFILVLCRVRLTQNLGALLRTASAAGVHGIVIPPRGAAAIDSETIRISQGAALHVPVIKEGLLGSLKVMKRRGLWIAGAEAGHGKAYFETDLTGPLALVLGGEDEGLSSAVTGVCDFLIQIPIVGHVPSLNVSAAGAVLMYEKLRQERSK